MVRPATDLKLGGAKLDLSKLLAEAGISNLDDHIEQFISGTMEHFVIVSVILYNSHEVSLVTWSKR